jgi:hypothetical protein
MVHQGELFHCITRADQIFLAFVDFHKKVPKVWTLFERYSLELVRSGAEHGGAQMVWERIRWFCLVESGQEVKLNNNFTAYYARMFLAKYPEHGEFFSTRRRISDDRRAADQDRQFFNGGSPVNERELMEKLLWLTGACHQ